MIIWKWLVSVCSSWHYCAKGKGQYGEEYFPPNCWSTHWFINPKALWKCRCVKQPRKSHRSSCELMRRKKAILRPCALIIHLYISLGCLIPPCWKVEKFVEGLCSQAGIIAQFVAKLISLFVSAVHLFYVERFMIGVWSGVCIRYWFLLSVHSAENN